MRHALTLAVTVGLAPSLAVAEEAPPDESRLNLRTDFTAYTRPKGRLAVGPFKAELGIIDQVTLGTYVPPWFAFTLIGTPMPNLYLKARSWWSGPLTLAVRGGFLYVDGSGLADMANVNASGNVTVLTSEVDVSLRLHPRLRVSLGFDYTHLVAVGGGSEVATSVEGAAMTDVGTARLFTQWQLTDVFGLTFLARYVAFQSPYATDVSTDSPGVSIQGDLTAAASSSRPAYAIVPGVSFDWTHWEVYLGVGYGSFEIPVVGIPTNHAWPIVDFALAFRFDVY